MSRSRERVEKSPDVLKRRLRWLFGCFGVAGGLVLAQAFQLQAFEQERWAQAAADQQRERVPLPARRGSILDRDGVPLALSHETYRVSVAPRELSDRAGVQEALQEVLGLSAAQAKRATNPDRRWVVLGGRFSVEQRRALGETRGVYFERRLERFYPQGPIGREVIGTVSGDGRALGGVEQQFDELLRGEPGYSVLRRNARGQAQAAISLPVVPPSDGADIQLTIDLDLQEIADVALREAIDSTQASGGDLLILDPHSGEILAAASRRNGRARSLAAITEPYEPGSTLKPFTVAALLAEGRAQLSDSIYAEMGVWRSPSGRTITDSHREGWLSLRNVLVYSSNIGVAKFADRLAPGEQYEYLRDFGFGTPTGVEYPAEASGRLRRPANWTRMSPESLAMGYELSVTPLQLALAYGALANGGVLMEPRLVRRITSPDGTVLQERKKQGIRRVIPDSVAGQLTEVLVQVVQEGTAQRAALTSFAVAGKTGTARRTGASGRYEAGAYTATFASYFPARDPQVVILVKLDRPQGSYYAGSTAAPVTRETLESILATRSSGVDAHRLLHAAGPIPANIEREPRAGREVGVGSRGTYVFVLDAPPTDAGLEPSDSVVVPSLDGLLLRDASRRAHALGFRVRLRGAGRVRQTEPAAGRSLQPGDTLLLIGEDE